MENPSIKTRNQVIIAQEDILITSTAVMFSVTNSFQSYPSFIFAIAPPPSNCPLIHH